MSKARISQAVVKKAALIQGKRARLVVDHILEHGGITTEDLENYGYKHPPRAVRDVREQGLPLERFWTQNRQGRKIAGYRFGDPAQIRHDRVGGRRVFSKEFHRQVCQGHDCRCGICGAGLEPRYLQVDHRVPYEVSGEPKAEDASAYMPLCGSCNRAKSWSCEHCRNGGELRDPRICAECYWARPETYRHVAMVEIRRLDLAWQGDEVPEYEALADAARRATEALPAFVKHALRRALRQS